VLRSENSSASSGTLIRESFGFRFAARTPTAEMTTMACASGKSSVIDRSIWAQCAAGVNSLNRASAPPVELHARLAAGEIDDSHVAPEHTFAQSGSESLRAGFLRRETFRIACASLCTPVRFGALDVP